MWSASRGYHHLDRQADGGRCGILMDALLTKKPGEVVPVQVARDTQQQMLLVTLGEAQMP